jgi:hypothetical protein
VRKRFEIQYELGAVPIEELDIPTRSRDEMPPVLRALQFIYTTPELNKKVFDILESKVMADKKKTGRHGMTLWEILVLATVRLARDADYDQLHYIAESDFILRSLLGANRFGETQRRYPLQTIKDNISLLDEETIEQINELVVKAGHQLLKKNDSLDVKIDSYVLESNVHFPTDINLLFDAGRKCLEIARVLSRGTPIKGWRKYKHRRNRLKAGARQLGKLSVSGGKGKSARVREAAIAYLEQAEALSNKLKNAMPAFEQAANSSLKKERLLKELNYYFKHLNKHIDLVRRRLVYGESIPHQEKVFSLFEPYTEWIKKGKAGNRPELGLPIAVAKDQHGFILKHRVMQDEHDIDAAVPMGLELIEKYTISSLSFDKNFWSPDNYKTLAPLVSHLVMPKKGKLTQQEYEREHSQKFKALKRQHASVESSINALEHHGLNRCPDKGIAHFKRYAALGVLAYNLHKLGDLLLAEDRKVLSNKSAFRKAA